MSKTTAIETSSTERSFQLKDKASSCGIAVVWGLILKQVQFLLGRSSVKKTSAKSYYFTFLGVFGFIECIVIILNE